MQELSEFIKVLGPTAGLAVAFLWITMRRQEKLEDRMKATEDYIRGDLKEQNAKTTAVIAENTAAMRDFRETMESIPCRLEHAK